ncbi:MAG: virulence factor family protein [Candidatus Schekmanbacteria bacterium]|nr:virulence factor family protein [Candidatus Schekmanbacteria bacterium]
MRRLIYFLISFFILSATAYAGEETLKFGRFGNVMIYRNSLKPSHVVLFVSGDGGWNLGVIDMAKSLSALDAIVVGIDITHYMKELRNTDEKCSYPAADFELLSKFIQKHYDFPKYEPPVLVGYSSGATLVYAVLVQAPTGTFQGAISLGFCPDLPLDRPLCRGSGLEWKSGPKGKGYSFLPFHELKTPWIALQGEIDMVCDAKATELFVKQVGEGKLISLPNVGHGFSVPKNWMPQFKEAFTGLFNKPKQMVEKSESGDISDLPVVEVMPSIPESGKRMAIMVSGDGGWAGIDRELAGALAAKGIPVAGVDSLQYFWKPKNPEIAANDLERIIKHYLNLWGKERIVIVGYSLGADVIPFMITRLSSEVSEKIELIALLGPEHTADFEFHITDWIGLSPQLNLHPLLPELKKIKNIKILCFYGDEEKDSLCRDIDIAIAKPMRLEGGHHFGGNYQFIADSILNELK